VFAIRCNRARGNAARPLIRHAQILGRNHDAGGEALEVDGKIDTGQRLIEIVDVEQDVVFRRVERAKIHQMTVAAGLNRNAGDRLAH